MVVLLKCFLVSSNTFFICTQHNEYNQEFNREMNNDESFFNNVNDSHR